METVTFGSQEVKDMFFASNRNGITSVMNGKYNGDYFVATVGLTSYTSLQAAINAAEDGATIELVKNLGNADPMKNFTENVTVDKNIIIAGKGSNPGTYTLTSPNASIQGPDGMNVEVNIEGYEVVNKNGVYALVEVIKAAELNGVAYKTLAEALAAARDGDTITLLADNAEVFAFAQNGGNITIDGNDFAFTGVITLSGEGHLTFTDMKVVAPAGQNGATIILNSKNNAPDITFYDCILTLEGVMNYTSIVYATADANNNVVFEECEASNLSYLVSTNQTGFASVTVENTVATKMASLLKCNKCTNVTIKNVTCEGNTILQVKASNKTNLHLENVKFTVTYAGYSPILMSAPDTGVSALYTIGLKGENIFVDKNGVSFTNENLVMTQDAARCIYEIVDLNPKVAQIGDKTYATLQEAIDAATAGQTITFLADITENVTINKSITIDGDNFKYTGTMNVKVVDLTITEVEFINGIVFKDKAANSGGTGGTYKFTFCNFTGENKMDYAINLYHTSTVVIEDCKMTGYAAFLQLPSSNSRLSVKNVEINAIYYGFKIDYSGSGDAVIMENVTVNAGEYALYHSNYGAKTHVIKNCTFNGGIEGIRLWDRNTGIINSFRFEGENTVSSMTNSKHVTYVLAVGATVTAPNTITATATKAGYSVKYEGGKYYTVTNFKATKTNIRFGNDLSLIFAIPQYEEFDENFYAVITYPNGDSEIVTQIVYFNNWMTDDDDLSGYYIVECSGLAAKQMTDEVSIQFFKKAGNEDDLSDDISLGDLVTTSIRDYSLSRLGKSTDEKFKTLIVDMLNYGTTAQVYFGYNTGTPANEDVDQTLASTSFTACPENHVHVQKYSDNSLVATSVRFDNSISLVFRVRVSDPSKFTPVFTYTDHMGTTHTVKARFIDAGNDETVGHTFAVELVGLVAADAHQLVTCTVYQNDADGELTNKVVAKYEDCVANYVARRIATGSTATPEAKDLYTSFMTYADAAYAYKHQN